jgi:hypothetical protein
MVVRGWQASTRLLDCSILSALFLAEQGFFSSQREAGLLFLPGSNRYGDSAFFYTFEEWARRIA